MNDIPIEELIEKAKRAAVKAGIAIMDVYTNASDVEIQSKADDSPLTLADRRGHEVIVAALEETKLPILSEEGKSIPYQDRKNWEYFWMVDPLDGTKEFIKRNGEFTVNIALIHRGKSIAGVVYAPVLDKLFWAIPGEGAWMEKGGERTELNFNPAFDGKGKALRALQDPQGAKIVGSRSHMNDETREYMEQFQNPEIVPMGSSLKFLVLSENEADVYPRFAPTMEWDTAAAHAVLSAAGGRVLQKGKDEELEYNKEDLLNPHFLCCK